MADILDAGALFLVAGLCVVAVVGAADRLGPEATPDPSTAGPDDRPTAAETGSAVPDARNLVPEKHADDDKADKHGHGHGKGDRDDDGRRDGDEGDEEGEEKEEEDEGD